METYLQYKRLQRAVQLRVTEAREKCVCKSENAASEHSSSCPLATLAPPFAEQQNSTEPAEHGLPILLVGWDDKDPHNPANYSTSRRFLMTFLVSLIALSVTAASAIDAAGVPQYSAEFGVSKVVGSLATGLFLVGFGIGSLCAGPFSETFGRNAIYLVTMLVFLIFIMAAALAPNLHSHLIFRFIAGFFGSTPLTCGGGTVADLWNPLEKTYAFPIYALPAFAGPMVGQLIGSYIPTSSALGWRWLEWIMLIVGGTTLVTVVSIQPETYGNLLLNWKASILRTETSIDRYRAPMELRNETLGQRLLVALYRPFLWSYTEPIILLMALYLTVVYIVLFTFLEGYDFVFGETYGLSQDLTSITWAGSLCGTFTIFGIVPDVYLRTAKHFRDSSRIQPETRLWYAMLGGALALPISLFWMGWTSSPSISIWSPLIASVLFGHGIMTIFVAAHMYIIDSYGVYSASALGFMAFTRYIIAGGITVAGRPIYQSIGVHYTLTILGAISAAMACIPYVLYRYGARIRKFSRHAVDTD